MIPYKNRSIDFSKPVEVYRNLNRQGRVYSIRQKGIVVAHATNLILHDVSFVVQKSGLELYKKSGIRNVHAWLKGTLSTEVILSFGWILDYSPLLGFYVDDGNSKYYADPKGVAKQVVISANDYTRVML